jgi:hypothetical protein
MPRDTLHRTMVRLFLENRVPPRYLNIKIALTGKVLKVLQLTTTMTMYAVLLHHTPEGLLNISLCPSFMKCP